ncbi:MAG TPA: ATP-binding protein, partial [Pyrinomonadaceae bacterium]
MNDSQQIKILSNLSAEDFVGRNGELEKLVRHAQSEIGNRSLLLLSAPATGATELLRQAYDRLFREQSETIPFYFSINRQDKTAKDCAVRFLQTFLLQTVAFRRQDAKLLDASPGTYEIAGLAPASDAPWIDRLVTARERENKPGDENSFVRNCLSAPLRAAAQGAQVFVMIDDLQNAENLAAGTNLLEALKEIYSRSNVQFVFAGRRRYILKATQSGGAKLSDAEIMRLNPLSIADAEFLIENFSEKYRVKVNDQTRDLIIRQFDSNPLFIESLFIAAKRRETNLDSFQTVQQIYVDELFGGRIGKSFDAQLYDAAPNFKNQTRIIRLLQNLLSGENKRIKNESWQKH